MYSSPELNDFSTLRCCRTGPHSVETVLGILIFSGASSVVRYSLLMLGSRRKPQFPVRHMIIRAGNWYSINFLEIVF